MYSACDIACYFLSKIDDDAGDVITNLKMQKLLYYAQGSHLALKGEPLFGEKIQAWTHGPVVPDAFHRFKKFGDEPLECPEAGTEIDPQTAEILDEVYAVFGQFSAWKLRNMTHEEPPWKNTPSGQEISHESLREYFATQLV